MKNQQSGFTLVEIAIVLVIIGLLLGGILKGQELINSAKVKSMANDFRTVESALYGYQDRFKALPGDHAAADVQLTGATKATTPSGTVGNGQINGTWDSATGTDESCLVWQHLRFANLLSGPTTVDCTAGSAYLQKNADGGRVGISSTTQITGMTGSFFICSGSILGRFARQLDTQLDDGRPDTGSVRIAAVSAPTAALTDTTLTDNTLTIVCKAI
ncbi:MAG: prepilin-type N-terminal cleavage/methylation domain-containing protein [Betaproteobacteria bacterium]|nr:prepilin-type N-terminal cleavage/methylation domain-containing protein [Betaproteobacteria bacterium]